MNPLFVYTIMVSDSSNACPSSSLCKSHCAGIIKTWGQQLFLKVIKDRVEVQVHSVLYENWAATDCEWESGQMRPLCVFFLCSYARATANKPGTYAPMHEGCDDNTVANKSNRDARVRERGGSALQFFNIYSLMPSSVRRTPVSEILKYDRSEGNAACFMIRV